MFLILCDTFLYDEQIGRNYCRTSNIKPFINNFNWENISFPPQEQDHKTFEMNNKSIALNVLQVNEQKISHYYKSEFNKTREKQVILLILTDEEQHHYVAVKNLNSLLKDKNKCSEHFCINCFKTKSRLEKHYQVEDYQFHNFFFTLYLHSLNKPADNSFYPLLTQNQY